MRNLRIAWWPLLGGLIGGILGIVTTIVITEITVLVLSPDDPSAGSVGIVIIGLLPGGVLAGLVFGLCAADIKNRRIKAGEPVLRSRKVFIALGIIFGIFGFHNFYAGYHKRAVAQLLITLFFGWFCLGLIITVVWVIFELIKVVQAADGVKMT